MLRTPFSAILFGCIVLPAPARAGEIATVTVTGKKQPVTRKLDKTVHDVSSMVRAANGSAQDVLQSIPELSVAADGRIAVKGNPQVTVLVDGKPTAALSGDDRAVALQTMSGTDIASVEVITSPSAAHGANGGAIVNIVLKRNRKAGAHAQLRASVADQGLWNAGVSGDVTRNNLSVHGTLARRHDGTLKSRQSAAGWLDSGSAQAGQTMQASQVFVRRAVDSATLGIDYDLGDRDSLSLSSRYNARRSRPLLDTFNVVRSGAAATLYHRISQGPNEQSDDSASLGYSHRGKGTAFKAMLQRSNTAGLVDKSYRDVFIEPARAGADGRGATRSARRLSQATADWSWQPDNQPWSTGQWSTGQWGAGLDISEEVNDLRNYQAAVDRSSGAETPDPDTSNGYAVATTLSAAYLTNQIRHGPWEVLLGGRIERMALRVHPARGAMRTSGWQAFNPSLNLRYAASARADLTLGYRRSLQRPDPRDLNPFTTYIDAQNLSRGNPDLAPQRLTAWEIGTSIDAGNVSGSLGAFHRTSRETVADARTVAGNVIIASKQNGGRIGSAGMTGAVEWKAAAGLRLGVDGGAWRVALDMPDPAGPVHQDRISGYLNVRAGYSAGRDDVALDAHVQSAGLTPPVRHGPTSSVNLSWKRQVTETLSLTVNASDIFDGSRRTWRTDTGTFHQAGFDHFVARRVYLGLVKKIE